MPAESLDSFLKESPAEAGMSPEAPLAERVGFEPTNGFPLPVFKTGAFVHSATPPGRLVRGYAKQEEPSRDAISGAVPMTNDCWPMTG